MKACKHCGVTKPLSEYYVHRQMADGHLNFCKTCTKTRVKQKRWSDIEAARDYEAKRSERRKLTPEYAASRAERQARWRAKYPEKHAAHTAVNNAIKDGKLVRQPCERCSSTRFVHAHHDDYSKPLDVRWLCVIHHRERHRELEAA